MHPPLRRLLHVRPSYPLLHQRRHRPHLPMMGIVPLITKGLLLPTRPRRMSSKFIVGPCARNTTRTPAVDHRLARNAACRFRPAPSSLHLLPPLAASATCLAHLRSHRFNQALRRTLHTRSDPPVHARPARPSRQATCSCVTSGDREAYRRRRRRPLPAAAEVVEERRF